MTLRQLETFYWIVRLGGFLAAANHLNAAQSTVSMRIQELEASLGVTLFDRDRRAPIPTRAGRDLYEKARQLLALAAETRHQIGDPALQTGTLRLGVTELVAVTWLSDLVAAINERHPNVVVELSVDLTIDQISKLRTLEIDVALVPGPLRLAEFTEIHLGNTDFRWMASPSLQIADTIMTPKDLHEWPLLLLTQQSNLHLVLGNWLEAAGPRKRNASYCNSISAVAHLAMGGVGIAYLPIDHYRSAIEAGQLVVLRTEPPLPSLEYYAVYNRGDEGTFTASIAEMARQHSRFFPVTDDPSLRQTQ